MAQIQTVRGLIDSAQLGTTLMHEHVFILDKEISENYPENCGIEEKRIADAVARLNELKSRGVDTIVDLTVIGLCWLKTHARSSSDREPTDVRDPAV